MVPGLFLVDRAVSITSPAAAGSGDAAWQRGAGMWMSSDTEQLSRWAWGASWMGFRCAAVAAASFWTCKPSNSKKCG